MPSRVADPQQSVRRRAALISLLIGILMFVMKTGAYFITNSAAILSDAMESVVHVIATSVAFYSILLIARPADPKHPYGYGKAEYFSAGVEGSLIVIAAIAICYEAVQDLILGSRLKSLDVGAWFTGAAGAINLALGFFLIRTGKTTKSLVLVADGKHVLTDSYTSIGVLIGVILVQITGVTVLDPLFAIAVALNIILTGYKLVAESVRGLMNTADQETLDRTVAVLNRIRIRMPDVIDVHRLRAWRAGEKRFIDFHLMLPYYLRLKRVHEIQDELYAEIRREFDGQAEIMVHLDPCRAAYCPVCREPDCPVRAHEPVELHEFTVAGVQAAPMFGEDDHHG